MGFFALAAWRFRHEYPIRDNPGWKDFKLELIGIDHMDENGWKQYILTQAEEFYKDGHESF